MDVLDCEYAILDTALQGATDFQFVMRAHRNFLATVLRVSMIDQVTVQEAIDRLLQACLRFIAVCRLLHQQEGMADDEIGTRGAHSGTSYSPYKSPASKMSDRVKKLPVVVPPEEIEAVRKDFFSQMAFLFQVMRKAENRGFMFRLDFNGFMSTATTTTTSTATSAGASGIGIGGAI